MIDPKSQYAEFRFGLAGMIPKESPDLLRNGQYRFTQNLYPFQEGSLSSRFGIKELGQLTASLPSCYFIKKLVVSKESDPLSPSTNPRYLGILSTTPSRDLYRTTDYATATPVYPAADSSAAAHWEMAAYSAGVSGSPWAYFACPNAMVKDNGKALYSSPLPLWGILPAYGVANAVLVKGSIVISNVLNSNATWAGVIVQLASPAGLSDFESVTITGAVGVTVATTDGRTDLNSTWDIRIGVPDTGGNIVNADTYFRIFDSNGQAVTATGTYTASSGSVTTVPTAGNLEGGAESSPLNTASYDYIYTYVESATGDEGNPSQVMLVSSAVSGGSPIGVHNGQVTVTVWGTDDSRIGKIAVYRRGGTLSDTWRLIGYTTNPGLGSSITLSDNTADIDLAGAQQVSQDNDPPVTSSLPVTLTFTLTGTASAGRSTLTVSAGMAAAATRGTIISISSELGTDFCTIDSVNSGANQITTYLQFAHAAGDVITMYAITGQPCHLTLAMPDGSVLVAGDPNNPHLLYKSKTGYPQYFPLGTDAAGAITTSSVGTPSNGIVNMCELRGQVVCLNSNSIFEIAIISGSLLAPAEVFSKGLVAQSAWCKVMNEVWFLSDDGIYSWDGGGVRKRSEAIDQLFIGKYVNGMSPVSYMAADLYNVRMEYNQGLVRFLYTDTAGNVRELVCDIAFQDRWFQYDENDYENTSGTQYPIQAMLSEPDTGSLVLGCNNPLAGALFGIANAASVSSGVNFTSDWWEVNPGTSGFVGAPIAYDMKLPWFDMGQASIKKIFEEIWIEMDPQLFVGIYAVDSTMTVDILLDYSDTPAYTVVIAGPSTTFAGRQMISLLMSIMNVGSAPGPLEAFGKEAKAISFRIHGSAFPTQPTFYRLIFQYRDTGMITAGGATDWMDLGAEHDKKLYQMTVTFDTEGTDRTITLDTITGINGNTYNQGVQSFTLSNPTVIGAGRAKKVFPVADGTIAKLVRVRPISTVSGTALAGVAIDSTAFFKIESVTFEKEVYPPDIVSFTPWESGGYEYDKYCNQVDLEVNTNNVAVVVHVQADGTTVNQTFTVTGTDSNRRVNLTMPTGRKGKNWRLFCDPNQTAILSGGGQFQLFSHRFIFQKADLGEVGHTFDYDDLGHPYDKLLQTVVIEYDTTAGGPLTLQMDTISGINGTTLTSNVASFVLGTGRGKTEFAIAPDVIVKMIRLYPAGTPNVGYKQWKYTFQKIDYPPDTVEVTEWRDASDPDDKEPSWLSINADTNNVAASVTLQNEHGSVMVVSHTGTSTNREQNYPIPADTRAKMWRLTSVAGSGGKFQLFSWGFRRWSPFSLGGPVDPPESIYATPWTDFGYPFDKIARNLIITINTNSTNCSVGLQTEEAGTVETFTLNTSFTYRRYVLACTANLIGKLWRLVFAQSNAQLWDWSLDFVKEPPAVTAWYSYEQTFGYVGFKFIKQIWLEYVCASSLTVTIQSDTGSYTATMPSHANRTVDRFYLPSVWTGGLNKSKVYAISITAATPFKLYAQGSAVEWIPVGEDQKTAYRHTAISQFITLGL